MHLLLLACSQSKDTSDAQLPAIRRYMGPSYRILHKLEKERGLPGILDIYILSGKYGLVRSDAPLPYYDQRISAASAAQSGAPKAVRRLFKRPYTSIFVNMGTDYRNLLDLSDSRIVLATGRIGEKNGKMKKWIEDLY